MGERPPLLMPGLTASVDMLPPFPEVDRSVWYGVLEELRERCDARVLRGPGKESNRPRSEGDGSKSDGDGGKNGGFVARSAVSPANS